VLTGNGRRKSLLRLWSIFDFSPTPCRPWQRQTFTPAQTKDWPSGHHNPYGPLRDLVRRPPRRMKTDIRSLGDLPDQTEIKRCGRAVAPASALSARL